MPKYNNSFRNPKHVEQTIVTEDGDTDNESVIGTVRLKPSTVLWKPSGAHRFFSVPLQKFTEWIQAPSTKATRVKK